MKLRVFSQSGTILLSLALFFLVAARFSDPGIRVKEQKANSTVYEIRLTGLDTQIQAAQLDARMKSKTGIISSQTAYLTGVCTVEAERSITVQNLRDVVRQSGMGVAKSFE